MPAEWCRRRALILVRTYPVPAKKGIEVSCTAAVTDDGKWLRLFPIPYRFLDPDQRFKKYHWIEVDIRKATDPRPESYNLNADTIKVLEHVPAGKEWRQRRSIIQPLMRGSLCEIRRAQQENESPTLGIFKPAEIKRLIIEPTKPEWTQQQLIYLQQVPLFRDSPAQTLEKIPFDFSYEFKCADADCLGHTMICTDWEMGESYRRWRRDYGNDWESKFRQRYEAEMISKYDTHFYVVTVHQHPTSWIIVGLFYPPKRAIDDLFDQIA